MYERIIKIGILASRIVSRSRLFSADDPTLIIIGTVQLRGSNKHFELFASYNTKYSGLLHHILGFGFIIVSKSR